MTPWRSMPAVQATIGGQGPLTLGIDTGYPATLTLADAAAQRLGLRTVGQAQASDPSGRNPIAINVYRAGEVRIGGLTIPGLDVTGGGAGPTAIGLDGVLGMGLFRDCTLVLDFAGRKVAVTHAGLPAPDGQTIFAVTASPFFELPLQIGQAAVLAHLDTGQTRSALLVPQETLSRLATRGAPRSIGQAHTISQTFDIFAVGLAAAVRLGGVTFPVTEVGYPTPVPIANLGSLALQGMKVSLDQRTARLRFETAAAASSPTAGR
jgi:hypothetical protein